VVETRAEEHREDGTEEEEEEVVGSRSGSFLRWEEDRCSRSKGSLTEIQDERRLDPLGDEKERSCGKEVVVEDEERGEEVDLREARTLVEVDPVVPRGLESASCSR